MFNTSIHSCILQVTVTCYRCKTICVYTILICLFCVLYQMVSRCLLMKVSMIFIIDNFLLHHTINWFHWIWNYDTNFIRPSLFVLKKRTSNSIFNVWITRSKEREKNRENESWWCKPLNDKFLFFHTMKYIMKPMPLYRQALNKT